MKNKHKVFLIFYTILLSGCSNPIQESESAHIPEQAEGLVALTAAQVQTAGIGWENLHRGGLTGALVVAGEWRVHPEGVAQVGAPVDGVVTALFTSINKPVGKGAVLARLRVPGLMDLQQDFLETRERLKFLEAEYKRFQTLQAQDATAVKQFQKAQADWQEVSIRLDIAAQRLRLYHLDPDKLQPGKLATDIPLLSTIAGTVTRTFVSTGTALPAGMPVCEVVDLGQMHADLFVFEKDLSAIREGQAVQLLANSGEMLPGRVFSVDQMIDPERRAVRVHARLTNGKARPMVNGAYLEARLAQVPTQGYLVPAGAMVREGLETCIYLFENMKNDLFTFRRVLVETGQEENGMLVIQTSAPLSDSAKVVVKGAYYVSAQAHGPEGEH